MKKHVLLVILLFCLVSLLGCGRRTTFVTPGGKVSVDEKGGTFTAKGKEGEVKFGSGVKMSQEELGVPPYPGASQDKGGAFSVASKGEEGKSLNAGTFMTSDSAEKVAAFYGEKLGKDAKKTEVSTPDGKTIAYNATVGKRKINVVIFENLKEHKTTISIVSQQGEEEKEEKQD